MNPMSLPFVIIGGLNGGPPSEFHLGELPPNEFPGCLPFNSWWAKPLFGTWVDNPLSILCTLILTGIVVVIGIMIDC
jgi:hypothetical protein